MCFNVFRNITSIVVNIKVLNVATFKKKPIVVLLFFYSFLPLLQQRNKKETLNCSFSCCLCFNLRVHERTDSSVVEGWALAVFYI